jgi:hypothetical protein
MKKRGRKESGRENNERHFILRRKKTFPGLKVPRQCPFVLLVKIALKEGKLKNVKYWKNGHV